MFGYFQNNTLWQLFYGLENVTFLLYVQDFDKNSFAKKFPMFFKQLIRF